MPLDREYVNDSLEMINKCLDHFINHRGENLQEDRLQEVLLDFYLSDLKVEVKKCRTLNQP